MSFKLYNIESRKGGVGKTTIALNLAQQLLKQGPVLLLDCDITGTSISEPASGSAFWKDDSYVVKDNDGKPLNLLSYFLEKFNKSSDKLDFQKEDSVAEKKINIVGSEIYGPTSRAIVDTRLLMDEIHSYWLLEFVDSIIKAFAKRFSDQSVSVIIDNSPGYVGFCQALHSYMFRLGPDMAKFILVSSIDAQDLQACVSAADEIRQEVRNRMMVARYYASKLEKDFLDPTIETFMGQDSELSRFFFSLVDDEQLLKTYTKEYKENGYLSLIINKVPQTLRDDGFEFDYDNVIPEQQRDLFHTITFSESSGVPQTIVLYDEAIAYQYYIRYLKEQKEQGSYDSYWTRRFRDLQLQIRDIASMNNRVLGVIKLDTLYSNLLSNLNQRNYGRLARTMQRSWAPGFALNKLDEVMMRIFRSPMLLSTPVEQSELKDMLHVFIQEQIRILQKDMPHPQDVEYVLNLVDYMESFAGFNRETRNAGSLFFVAAFVKIYVSLYLEDNVVTDFRSYVLSKWNEKTINIQWRELLGQSMKINEELSIGTSNLERKFAMHFIRLYDAFNYTLLRMIDAPGDFEVIIEAIKLYVPITGILPLSKEMSEYLSDVIVRKTDKYDKEKLTAIKANSFVMKSIQELLKMILKNQNVQ
jgi:hypothetical protein